jgi:hypothetical protein
MQATHFCAGSPARTWRPRRGKGEESGVCLQAQTGERVAHRLRRHLDQAVEWSVHLQGKENIPGDRGALRGLVTAMLLYNCAAVAVLASAGVGARLVGVLMWPAVALHSALAVWCIACLRNGPVNVAGRVKSNP